MKRNRPIDDESVRSKRAKTKLQQTSWIKVPKDLANGVGSTTIGEQRYLYGVGAQAELFRLADLDGHRVSIALEINGTRQFTSFLDYNTFLDYYETFKGQRCFYTIDRSYSVEAENSLLHMDVEQYSEEPDKEYNEKMDLIFDAVRKSLPGGNYVEVLHEDLSR